MPGNTKPEQRRKSRAKESKARRKSKRRAFLFVDNSPHGISARFGAALRKRRRALGLTQETLAAQAGIDRSFLSTLECGRTSISLERADRLARAVGATISQLLNDIEPHQRRRVA